MKQYLELLTDILENGNKKSDRTLTGTLSVFGRQIRFNLNEGFPAVTTKKLAWKGVVSELLWFIEGSDDERRLSEILHGTRDPSKKTVWTPNAQSDYWKPRAQFEGDVGRIYGVQWREWGPRIGPKIDQLQRLIDGIISDPHGRRHIISAWNPGELDQMALPPCHVLAQFYVSNGKLSCQMYQRSADVFLGVPFNIASYALFTHMIAQCCGLGVGEFILTFGDVHIYMNHIEQVKEQLTRNPFDLPTLVIANNTKDIGAFKMEDFMLKEYSHWGSISAEMAV